MDRNGVLATFSELLIEDVGGEQETLAIKIDENQYIFVDAFIDRFSGAELTTMSLSSHPKATPGWIATFEQWRQTGVLP